MRRTFFFPILIALVIGNVYLSHVLIILIGTTEFFLSHINCFLKKLMTLYFKLCPADLY